jgi:hypothetical protein
MKPHLDDKCVCGHTYGRHSEGPLRWCFLDCYYEHPNSTEWQHTFRLDNLTIIEKLAKERGLV